MAKQAAELRIADIVVIPDLYPRRAHEDRVVAEYREAIDALPPIEVVRKDGKDVLLDGYHRLLAHRLEGKETIRGERVEVDDILVEAIRRNARHGRQLSLSDKRKDAIRLWSRAENPIRDIPTLMAILSVKKSAAYDFLRDVLQEEKDARNARIRELWLDCYSQEEIAEETGLTARHLQELIPPPEELPVLSSPASLQSWTVWDEWGDCDDAYGCDYPGRLPGQVVENLLYYLTEPGDAVLDPMSGSGTTRDVCQAMGRRCFSSDARPFPGKAFIREHVVGDDGNLPPIPGTVARQKGYQLVVLDPPYWHQADYGKDRATIGAREGFEQYLARVAAVLDNALALVRPGGYVALIASSTMDSGRVFDPVPAWQTAALAAGAECWDRIIVPYTSQRASAPAVASAREAKRLLRRHRDLLVLRRPGAP